MTEPQSFYDLARVCTGASFLNSGSVYGRHWEQPPVPEDHPLYYARRGSDYYDVDLMINQPSLLSENYRLDPKATRHFRLWAALADPNDQHSWGDLALAYCARMVQTQRWESDGIEVEPAPADPAFGVEHYAEQGRQICWQHYTYNDSDYNDLDQDFVINAASPYSEVVLIQSHNGCDARGGFTPPVVATSKEDGPPDTGVQPYCQTCNAEADNLYDANEQGWRVVRLEDRAVLRCPAGHLDTWPQFPYYDGKGPEPDRFASHEPEPDDEDKTCLECGMDLIREGVSYRCTPPPYYPPKEQAELPLSAEAI